MSENDNSNSVATQNGHELKKSVKIVEFPVVGSNHIAQAGITRERSFVRTSNSQNHQVIFNFFINTRRLHLKIFLIEKTFRISTNAEVWDSNNSNNSSSKCV
jgi:hypothetical protein